MRIAFSGGALALVVGLAACGQARPLSEADKAAIGAVSDSFEARVRAGNDSGVAQLYTENAVFMPPNEGIVEGRAAIRAQWEAQPADVAIELTPVDVDGRGDLAYVRGTYVVSIVGSGGGPSVVDRGKYLEIRRREGGVGREWLIAVDIFNSDQPAMAPSPAPVPARTTRP